MSNIKRLPFYALALLLLPLFASGQELRPARWTAAQAASSVTLPRETLGATAPPRPNPLREKSFWLVVGGTAVLGLWDIEKTVQVNRECIGIFETNPILPFAPSRQAMYGAGIPIHLGAAFLTYLLGHSNNQTPRRLRFTPQALLAVGHIAGLRASYLTEQSCTRRR